MSPDARPQATEQAPPAASSPDDRLSSFDFETAWDDSSVESTPPPVPAEPVAASPAPEAVEAATPTDPKPTTDPEPARDESAPTDEVQQRVVSRRAEREQERQQELAALATARDEAATRAASLEAELAQSRARIAQLESATGQDDATLEAARARYADTLLSQERWDALNAKLRAYEVGNGEPLTDQERADLQRAEPLRAFLPQMHKDAATYAEREMSAREARFQANVGRQLAALGALDGVEAARVATPESIEAAGRHLYDAGADMVRRTEVAGLKEQIADLEAANQSLEARLSVGGLAPETGGRSPTAGASRAAWDHTAPMDRQFDWDDAASV